MKRGTEAPRQPPRASQRKTQPGADLLGFLSSREVEAASSNGLR